MQIKQKILPYSVAIEVKLLCGSSQNWLSCEGARQSLVRLRVLPGTSSLDPVGQHSMRRCYMECRTTWVKAEGFSFLGLLIFYD